jgi:hypothetical protein
MNSTVSSPSPSSAPIMSISSSKPTNSIAHSSHTVPVFPLKGPDLSAGPDRKRSQRIKDNMKKKK